MKQNQLFRMPRSITKHLHGNKLSTEEYQELTDRAAIAKDWKPTDDFTDENQTQRTQWAKNLFTDLRGLFDELHGWVFNLSNAKRRRGQCRYGDQTITVSKYYLAEASKQDLFNTITHELAHALLGKSHGHKETWKELHRAMGGTGARCCTKRLENIKFKYAIDCTECEQTIAKRLKKSKLVEQPERYKCPGCGTESLSVRRLR